MSENEEFLREKAKLLITRERELHALTRKHKGLARWLALALLLPELVDPTLDISAACGRVADRMRGLLDLHTVKFHRIDGAVLWALGTADGGGETELEPAARALVEREAAGTCIESGGEEQAALSRAVGLFRFLWHRMTPAGSPPLLLVAGYDRERAPFYRPFDGEDLAHFTNTAHQLTLLLGNNNLVRELERDKQRLATFNQELEHQVENRTRELATANGDLERAIEALRENERRIQDDIEEARLFQQKVLPKVPRSAYLDWAVAYRPLERVGGDLFDVLELSPRAFRLFVADATGHGVQAAMRTILIKSELERLMAGRHAPHLLLQRLSERLSVLFPGGETMCTGCCVDLDVDERGRVRVTYANGGGPPILHWSGESVTRIYGETPFLGIGEPTWPEPLTFSMTSGDLLLVATDGLPEQQNEEGKPFEDVVAAAPLASAASAADVLERLLATFDAFRGAAAPGDDVTVIAIRVCEVPSDH